MAYFWRAGSLPLTVMDQENVINKYIYAFFIMLLGLFLFLQVKEFFSAFLGSIVFYTLFKGFMLYLTRKRRLKKVLASIIIIVISFIIVVLPVSILFTVIYNKITALASDPELVAHTIQKFIARLDALPFEVNTEKLQDGVKDAIGKNIGSVLNSSFNILGNILMMYFFLFFLLINVNKMEASIIHYLPFRRSKIVVFGKELRDQTVSNAIGVPLVCFAQGLLAYISYRITGVPEPGLWGILTGFASVIPLVGTGLIWLPVTAYLFMEGETWQGFFVIGYSLALMTNVDNLIRMLLSNKIGNVHPVITVLGIIIGLKAFGLPGLVFGPLLISYFLLLLKLYYVEYSHTTEIRDQRTQERNVVNYLLNQFSLFTSDPRKGKRSGPDVGPPENKPQ